MVRRAEVRIRRAEVRKGQLDLPRRPNNQDHAKPTPLGGYRLER